MMKHIIFFSFPTYPHDCWGKVLPAQVPEHVRLVSGHLLDAITEAAGSEEPADGDGLEEADPQQAHPGGRIEVHQLE